VKAVQCFFEGGNGMRLKKTVMVFVTAVFMVVVLLAAAACGGGDDENNDENGYNASGTYEPSEIGTENGEINGSGEAASEPTPPALLAPPAGGFVPTPSPAPGRYLVDLPEYALLSVLSVNAPIVYGEELGSNATPPWGMPNWAYRSNLQPANEETRANPLFLLYADRRGPQDNPNRPFYGWLNFQANEVPEWLIGAHFIAIGHSFRQNTEWPSPYFYFTAAQDVYAFIGKSQRMDPANYIDELEGWELIYPVQFISTVGGGGGWRSTNFEDLATLWDEGLMPIVGSAGQEDFMSERFYLFKRFLPAGETAVVFGASATSHSASGFQAMFLTPEQYTERVPGGWDTVGVEHFVENLRPWRENE